MYKYKACLEMAQKTLCAPTNRYSVVLSKRFVYITPVAGTILLHAHVRKWSCARWDSTINQPHIYEYMPRSPRDLSVFPCKEDRPSRSPIIVSTHEIVSYACNGAHTNIHDNTHTHIFIHNGKEQTLAVQQKWASNFGCSLNILAPILAYDNCRVLRKYKLH